MSTRRTLILGGTGWLGREVARRALEAGQDVTCAARGASGSAPAGARFVAMDRTEPDAYDRLEGEWDEVVELSYAPDLVEPALAALAHRAAHWTLVSTVSVYARNDEPGADEAAAVLEPVDLDDYGQAKVAAERASAQYLGDRLLIVRPGLIVGPGDPTDRFGYWPARLARGGDVLVPEASGRFVQVIDVADLAAFVVTAGEAGRAGVVNGVGDIHSFDEFLSLTAEVTGFEGRLVAAADDWLLAHDVAYWAGPHSLPLWLPVDAPGFAQRSNAAYRDLGGTLRPLRETVADVLADERQRGLERPRRAGLTAEEEATLIAALE